MVLLGFADDILDLRWRVKLILPTVASIPLLMVYFVTYGITFVSIPKIFHSFLPKFVDLGILYYFYMSFLAVFCTNSINILAGINGVEAGQSLVIACSLVLNDILYIFPFGRHIVDEKSLTPSSFDLHLFSLYLLIPFIAVCFALFLQNKYPAKVFVGDTFCYFAGMLFAVVGILSRNSKTILLFFIPQVFNFLVSLPQLFHMVPCPRHRMPKLSPIGGSYLCPSTTDLLNHSISWRTRIGSKFLFILYKFGLVKITTKEIPTDRKLTEIEGLYNYNGKIWTHSTNLTLLNILLVYFGQMEEGTLTNMVMFIQFLSSVCAFSIRYGLVHLFY